MALVIRMKNVTRVLLFAGSLLLWLVALAVANRELRMDEYTLLGAALLLGVVQTWILAAALHT